MDVLIWIVLGLAIGAFAALVAPHLEGLEGTLLAVCGIFGALCFGFIGRWAGLFGEGSILSAVMAAIGAAGFAIGCYAIVYISPDRQLRRQMRLERFGRPEDRTSPR
ncbi:MAG: hypothetical protein Q8R35_01030 [bacterium]|nr:hypothetical protein [bacterium]